MNDELRRMFDSLSKGNPVYLPSKLWEKLNRKNIEQLEYGGLNNFKQTISQNYFTWVIGWEDPQFQYLLKHTPLRVWPTIVRGLLSYDKSSPLTRKQQIELSLFTRMLWRRAESIDTSRLLKFIEEPLIGNPFNFFLDGKLISQDLANSVLEFYSMREHFTPHVGENVLICELGAGYGRNAFVFMNAFPKCKYLVIDIPPALYVAQHYLTSIFVDKKTFKFRCFKNYSEVESEFEEADLAFLLPHQADMLPVKIVDLFINISSLHEMRMEQIHAYIKLIDRLTKGFFYTKQYLESKNPDDSISVRYNDYPIPLNWKQLYLRKPKVQTNFFEAMYSIP